MRRQEAALERRDTLAADMKSKIPIITIGLDLGDKKHAICVLNKAGEIVEERSITNNRESLKRLSQKYPKARIAMEVGQHSPWTSRFFEALGHEVLVANARKLRAIYTSTRKSDQSDAYMIARLARVDPTLTIGDPMRFESMRDVAPYLGLVPKRDQSGETDKQLGISKAGNAYLRRLLVSAAHYILGPFGPDCDLKRHGLQLAGKRGCGAKKKAVVAVARKLSVLMLTLWYNEDIYEPLRNDSLAA